MIKNLILIVILSLPLINSCSLNTFNQGSISVLVKFPENKFSVKAIPQNTSLILIRVTGLGIEENKPISFELTKEKNSRILSAVPTGNKIVKASALDKNGNILAEGENQISIEGNKLNKLEVELKIKDVVKPVDNNSQSCVLIFPREEVISDTLRKSLTDAGCKVEIN